MEQLFAGAEAKLLLLEITLRYHLENNPTCLINWLNLEVKLQNNLKTSIFINTERRYWGILKVHY